MHLLKTPEVDDLHTVFSHNHWEIVGESVYAIVKDIFYGEQLPTKIIRPLLSLSLKLLDQRLLKNFVWSVY